MLHVLGYMFMWAAAAFVVVVVFGIWVIGLIAIYDDAVVPLLEDTKKHPIISNIINKIEEYRNAKRP